MFRAYDAGRERLVAVKLFKLDLPPERVHQLVAAFEHLIAAELTHPAMAVPLATGIAGVSAYLAQDYVAAESLDLAVREYGAAPVGDALRVAAQLAGALDFAAVVNVAHGALHPRDILLSSDETRLTGIGVAQALERVGVAAPVRRPYTAPERMAGGRWDRRADVFSLAALIHELLWAHRITGTGDRSAESLSPLPGADHVAVQRVFARALADDPGARFETALEFVDALKSAFPDVAITAPEMRRKHEPPAASGRRRAKAADAAPAAAIQPSAVNQLDAHPPASNDDREMRLPLDTPDIPETRAAVEAPPAKSPSEPFDREALDLGGTEAARYDDVEAAPPVVAADVLTPIHEEAVPQPPPISLIEESRSAVWPLVAALLIGLALGFAGGYGIGTREHAGTVASVVPNAPPERTGGKEGTEVAIAEPPPQSPLTPVAAAPSSTAETKAPKPSLTKPPPPARTTPSGRAKNESAPAAAKKPTKAAEPRPQNTRSEREAAAASATTGRYQGRLDVDSRPTGARVFLDGKLIGTTPLAVPSVAAGEHAIRLERDGYRRWSSSVRVVAAEQNRVTASLER